jgi:ASC-1-like (ASCH) protein
MTEDIYVEIVKDDTVLTEEFYNSIEYYAYTVINGNYSEDLKSLMVNMLVYGAEAQLLFNYNTDFLATYYIDEDIIEKYATKMATPADPGYYSVIEPDGKYYFYDNTLELEADIGLNFYYEFTKADASSLKVTTSYVDFYGETHTNVISGDDLVFNTAMGSEMLKVSVRGLKSTDVFQAVTVVIEYNGEVVSTVTESVAGYCHYAMGADDILDGVCLALLKYGAAAEKYFG